MHSPMPNEHANGIFLSTLSYVTAPYIGLFIMISGALLLPIKVDAIHFLKRRFGKIAGPTLFWSLFYLTLNAYLKGEEIEFITTQNTFISDYLFFML